MSDYDKSFYIPGFLDLSPYRIERISCFEIWDNLVKKSHQATLFSESCFLLALKAPIGLWACYKGGAIVALVQLIENKINDEAISYPNAIYNGILLMPPDKKQNRSQIISEQFRITAYLAKELPNVYKNVFMSLHPSIIDIRPFLWHNYNANGPKYNVDIRYTSMIDLTNHSNNSNDTGSPLYAEINKSRRQEIRYANKKGVRTEEQFDLPLFISFYRKTFERQNVKTDNIDFQELSDIITNLYKNGRARMFISSSPDGVPGAIAIFGSDSKRLYYLFGASNPEDRNSHAGTKVLWDSFTILGQDTLTEVDLEGINSPKRGYFKLSFGGNIVPYYHISLKNEFLSK